MQAFASHPFAQGLRDYYEQQYRSGAPAPVGEHNDTFVPPVDVFNTEKAYVLHVALPGCVKEDVDVKWISEKGELNVAGVVHRPGHEEFLQTLSSSERKVGMFERGIKLPPPGSDEKEDIDAFSINAKLENGILIITVPKAEKEWTEVHNIDVD
ncbi:HSP20-like chaperone [Pseudomassariella vexata]|uniref:HSP20-like chaperone n=1 Tax=Pseudomassariella vexata TaxID=1141098 RepID=A0A1Y2E2X9_9PEZI|nr:HSP20-like chaperone [Pseudomassariella vexata]ORY65911.1 HSP20-like chaperone [Pseudomassariella vexata]